MAVNNLLEVVELNYTIYQASLMKIYSFCYTPTITTFVIVDQLIWKKLEVMQFTLEINLYLGCLITQMSAIICKKNTIWFLIINDPWLN